MMKETIRDKFRRHALPYDIRLRLADLRALALLSGLGLGWLPWSGSALAPSTLLRVLNEVRINRRRTVLELGAGLSTLYLAKVLRQEGGVLFSVEHDAVWMEMVAGWLRQEGLEDVVRLIYAPVDDEFEGSGGLRWYRRDVISKELADAKVKLLLVDGPPAHSRRLSLCRFPALPFLNRWLDDDFCVVLDDATRSGERDVSKRWATEFGLKFECSADTGYAAIATRGQAYWSA
jgi:hypothetical protein